MKNPQMTQPDIARFHGANYGDAVAAFRREGVIIIDQIFSPVRIAELMSALRQDYPEYCGQGIPDDYVDVGDNRIMAPIRYAAPFDCADIVGHPVLTSLLIDILADKFVFDAFGVVTSLPGATDQHVHRDGGYLFSETGIDSLLPASAVSVIVPLADMDSVNGSTAFWPASHRSKEMQTEAPFAAPNIPVGSMVIWDFRLQHRGLANRGNQMRPLLYLTACRPFWIDHRNFNPRTNAKLLASQAALDGLDEPSRSRFVRAELIP